MSSKSFAPLFLLAAALASQSCTPAPSAVTPILSTDPVKKITFTPGHIETRFDVKSFPDLPVDWTDYKFLVIEWRASSSERFQLGLTANDGPGGQPVTVSKRIGPFQNTWVRASIPLDYFRKPARDGSDLAATFNKHRDSYWININFGGNGPVAKVTAIDFQMDGPIPIDGQAPTLEIRSVKLARDDAGDAVLESAKVVDQFGQWIPAAWPGKAKSLDDLKKAWGAEDAALKPGNFGFDKYGGYASTSARATGFFRVEQVDSPAGKKWWFVDPDGHLFYSSGLNGVGTGAASPAGNRRDIFEGGISAGGGPGGANASFYQTNVMQRFQNADPTSPNAWRGKLGEFTYRRLDAWGFNTIAGFGATPPETIHKDASKPYAQDDRNAYTLMIRGNFGPAIMGMPDVYAPDFAQRAEQIAAQCDAYKNDSYLLGYFVGNEPPWPTRESMLCDAILSGADGPMKTALQDFLKAGDTPQRRRQFAYDTFDKYLSTITAAIKKHDPNHLTLGIRLGGEVPDEVYKASRIFDVCSINIYDFAIDKKLLDKVAALTGRPLIVGEFHFGTPGHGMGGGLRQVATQKDRGLAYAYYVEHAASHPSMIGTHWFQWLDQPSTGRNDGENYNIGLIDVTDQPYMDMVNGMIQTHQRIFDVHSGRIPPTSAQPAGKSLAEVK